LLEFGFIFSNSTPPNLSHSLTLSLSLSQPQFPFYLDLIYPRLHKTVFIHFLYLFLYCRHNYFYLFNSPYPSLIMSHYLGIISFKYRPKLSPPILFHQSIITNKHILITFICTPTPIFSSLPLPSLPSFFFFLDKRFFSNNYFPHFFILYFLSPLYLLFYYFNQNYYFKKVPFCNCSLNKINDNTTTFFLLFVYALRLC
jgi:hypothetical protein